MAQMSLAERAATPTRLLLSEFAFGLPITRHIKPQSGVTVGVGVSVLVGVGVPVKVAGVPVAVLVKVAEMVGVGLKQALCTKLTLTSSTHQPVAPSIWSVPRRKRK